MKYLTTLLLLIVPSFAFASSQADADHALLFSKPLRVLVISGEKIPVQSEVTLRERRVLFRKISDGLLYSLPVEEIDIEQTARQNGVRLPAPGLVVNREPPPQPRAETSATVATMQAVTTVGLAAREGERRKSRDVSVATPADRWTIFTGVSSIAETNINDEFEGTPDVGVIPMIGFNYRNRGERATVEASYTAAFHSYSRSEEWDRTSHNLSASFEPRWRGRWRSETEAEASLEGANEDRDLSDRYSLTQRLRLKLTDRDHLRLTAGYRLKLYEDDPTSDARNPYGGIDYRHRFASGAQWSLGYRHDLNQSEGERRDYRRTTLSTELSVPLAPEAFASIGVRRREQEYPSRFVRLDGELVPREDERWLGSLSLGRRFFKTIALALEYQYETRFSNDPDKEYHGHSVGLSLIRFW
jgi:hypothetical protein